MHIQSEAPLWVQQGNEFHDKQECLNRSRTLKRFQLDQAIRHFRIGLKSKRLLLHGIADLLLETDDQVIPVEFKLSEDTVIRKNMLYQLVAYGLIAEEHYNKDFKQAYVLFGKKGKAVHRTVGTALRQEVIAASQELRMNIENGLMPTSSAGEHHCAQCEFLAFCNDRF